MSPVAIESRWPDLTADIELAMGGATRAERPARVAIASYEFVGVVRNGGIGTACTELGLALAREGHDVELIFTGWGENASGEGFERWRSHKLVGEVAVPDPPDDPEIAVYEMGEEEADGEGFSWIVREGLGLPIMAETLVFSLPMKDDWRCYTAVLEPEDRVVAAGAMLIDDGVAQLGLDATLTPDRGRGCNKALLRRRLLDAAEAGCHTVFAELGECDADGLAAATRNLAGVGFVEAYRSRNWRRPALKPARVS